MSAPAKFLFDVDFGVDRRKPADQAISQAMHEAALAEAEARGYRTGQAAAARRGRRGSRAAASRSRMERIGARCSAGIAQRLARHRGRGSKPRRSRSRRRSRRKLAPALIAARAVRRDRRACERMLQPARRRAARRRARQRCARRRAPASASTEIAHAHGFDGRLVVLAEPDIAAGDCRIEWADGGVVARPRRDRGGHRRGGRPLCGGAPQPMPHASEPESLDE